METDPNGKAPTEPGSKLDEGKSPLHRGALRYFPRALKRVAEVSAFGANKYTWGGWRSVPNGINRYSDAIVRHLVAEEIEGDWDSDSGLLHASHAAWNALAVLELKLDAMENTERWAASDEAKDLVDQLNGSYYLRPNNELETTKEAEPYSEGVGGVGRDPNAGC